MIVGPRDQIESHLRQILRNLWGGYQSDVFRPGIWISSEIPYIEDRSLHIPVGNVGPLQDLHYLAEALIVRGVLQQWARDDAISDRDQREAVWNIGLQLAGKRPIRIKLGGVLYAGIGRAEIRGILANRGGNKEKRDNQPCHLG